MSKLITPKTRLMEILENFPGLEERLIAIVPTFNKLKNPVLRKTVAKIATVQQAASIAKMPVNDLVNILRKEANQELEKLDHNPDNYELNYDRPDWMDNTEIAATIDLSPILDAGEHPIHQVVSELKKLSPGKALAISAPFLPAPLIDKGSSLGYEHYIENLDDGAVKVYFKEKG